MKLECSYVQLPKIYRHLSGNELKVFVTMFDQWSMMKNEDGWYYRSQKQLCEDTGLTDRTLRDIIKKFVEKGVIFTTTYNDGGKMATYNKANEYKINMKKVVEMSKEKVVKISKEGGNFYHPSNNIIIKENNKIYNINIKTSEDITPDDGTLQDDEVENVFLNNSDDDWLNYEVKRSMTDNVNNDLKLNNMKKENEMSDNGTNAMNAMSEMKWNDKQGRSNASESVTKNAMTTSTLGDKNNTSKEFQNVPVDKSKVINNDCNVQGVIPNAKDCAPAPATEEWKPVAWDEDAIFGSGEPQNVSGDKLHTNEEKTQPEPQECPQNEFNRERMLELFKISAKETVLERFKEQLKEMDAYMQYLKKNDHFAYKIYLKEIWSWWNNPMNVWNSDFDFICIGNNFKRKYVA